MSQLKEGVYEHHSGARYHVVCTGTHLLDGNEPECVVYRDLKTGVYWSRPVVDFAMPWVGEPPIVRRSNNSVKTNVEATKPNYPVRTFWQKESGWFWLEEPQ